ncbi:MAG: NADP(H)-dependent aldo-keto reductase [Hydrogenophilaceae bacterium CG1_02_62_390]|nr:NADP(H)-dependent aldo-keto reductase [Betaproteobacteria bacterium]OIO79874.1 MAG: NADP(H)-dependent aldo-keto reductase [Hydrogenophilaceae bacterium CG1_02_62_390]PIW39286.1 MAG: NADP(H)-dependent aldo-keto reductase [Hydrogenophilales bacterium CG15_BIG_FIL_POST_REV_8_21_14_020_62_31]PIW70967.1 MAG: NADP(H)-dependent aldo-keto reductase [Hydrogenophilales bacterium CG12_big_fil_rev_8_21_14_0_65_61_21]PIX02516.1 MAG: NADP(H)-dependent aldo-keto reductase [Hydrogenophilales bacterium CG_4_
MDCHCLGDSDLNVSAVGLGTMTFGQQNTEAEAHAQLDYAFDQGINFIDTAEMYPVPPRAETCTRTETLVGAWLRRQPRAKVILATKVAGPNRSMVWIRGGPKALDRANIREAIEGSLKRLQTDYIDLYQIHWPARNVPMFGRFQFDPTQEMVAVPIREQLEALAELVQEGKVRYVGLSNEHPWGVMEFLRLAMEHGLPRVVSIQNAYSLINRSFEFGLAEIAYRERVGLLAYSPLAFGHLSAKYLDDPAALGRVTNFKGFAQRYEKPNVQPAVAAYAALARRHGLTPAELALSFAYRRWFVASTLIGATGMVQLKENLGAWGKPLTADILAEIEALHLRYMNPAP